MRGGAAHQRRNAPIATSRAASRGTTTTAPPQPGDRPCMHIVGECHDLVGAALRTAGVECRGDVAEGPFTEFAHEHRLGPSRACDSNELGADFGRNTLRRRLETIRGRRTASRPTTSYHGGRDSAIASTNRKYPADGGLMRPRPPVRDLVGSVSGRQRRVGGDRAPTRARRRAPRGRGRRRGASDRWLQPP